MGVPSAKFVEQIKRPLGRTKEKRRLNSDAGVEKCSTTSQAITMSNFSSLVMGMNAELS